MDSPLMARRFGRIRFLIFTPLHRLDLLLKCSRVLLNVKKQGIDGFDDILRGNTGDTAFV